MTMKIISMANQKGGTGKTTSAVNIGAGLARLNKRVLLVDLDPQAHLTYSLGLPAHEIVNTVYRVLKGETDIREAIIERNGLRVIPANLDLSQAELELSNIAGREVLLKEALDTVTGYDYILIDCSPSLGLLTLNAMTTAGEVYIPVQVEYLALNGLRNLLDVIALVKRRLNPELEIGGVIACRYDNRKNLNKEVIESLAKHFDKKLFTTYIRDNIAIAEAPASGNTIFEYAPNSHGAEDYLSLCKEIIKRGGK